VGSAVLTIVTCLEDDLRTQVSGMVGSASTRNDAVCEMTLGSFSRREHCSMQMCMANKQSAAESSLAREEHRERDRTHPKMT
jgi:hypothetical protein